VHDDSPDRDIEIEMSRERFRDVIYQRNDPPLGAVANWNGLIELATGRYILLIHHDEYPSQPDFFERVSDASRTTRARMFCFWGFACTRVGCRIRQG